MSHTAKYGHWFLLTSIFVQAMFLGHITSTDYALGRVFGFARAYARNFWLMVLGGLLVCLLGFFATASILLRRPWSKQLATAFCSAEILFILGRAFFTGSPDWWFALEACALPVVVLVYLAITVSWSKLNTHKVTQLS